MFGWIGKLKSKLKEISCNHPGATPHREAGGASLPYPGHEGCEVSVLLQYLHYEQRFFSTWDFSDPAPSFPLCPA